MKKLLLSVALLCGVAVAQPPSAIPTGMGGPAYQSAVNAWMQYLYTNKIQGLSSSVDSEVALFSGTGGKTIKRASLTGIPYMTSGVISAATSTHIIALFGSGSCSGYLKSDGTCDSGGGSGITTLNTLTGSTQTFSRTNDTNVTLTLTPSASDHNFALGWTGTLAIARGGTGASSTSQNFAFIGPTSGSGAPSFRALVAGDIPTLAQSKITSLVSDLAAKEPGLGNPASDGYVLKSTALGVRTWEALGAGHTQNTDTGTTQTTFQIDSGNSGPKLKNNAGVLEVRNAANDDYADLKAKTIQAGDGTVAGEATLYELSSNGTNYISWLAPDSITNTLRLKFANADPAAQALQCGAPSSNISTCTWTSYQPLDAALTALAAGSDFVQFSGPSSTTKTFTLPNVSSTLSYTVYSGTKALDTDAIASTACDTMTQSATGVASTDTVSWTFNADVTAVTGYAPAAAGGLAVYLWPTADTINIKVCNPTSSGITPGAVSLNLRVVR